MMHPSEIETLTAIAQRNLKTTSAKDWTCRRGRAMATAEENLQKHLRLALRQLELLRQRRQALSDVTSTLLLQILDKLSDTDDEHEGDEIGEAPSNTNDEEVPRDPDPCPLCARVHRGRVSPSDIVR